MKKFLALFLAVLMIATCAATLSACNKDGDTIKIGLSGPLTGAAAVYGKGVANAAQMAVDEINAAGGIDGVLLELKAMDDANDKTKVATISKASIQKIAEMKMRDLNAASLEAAMSMIAGTARSMGVAVEE